MRFQHTVETNASPEAIWGLWTDVATWPQWDTALEWARLDGPFALSSSGELRSKGGPESRFSITQLDPGASYTFTTALPLARLHIRRELSAVAGGTRFTHQVSFSGPLGFLFGALLGRGFRAMLPDVMERLRTLAERGHAV